MENITLSPSKQASPRKKKRYSRQEIEDYNSKGKQLLMNIHQ